MPELELLCFSNSSMVHQIFGAGRWMANGEWRMVQPQGAALAQGRGTGRPTILFEVLPSKVRGILL